MNLDIQICRVSLISDMVDEELTRYLKYQKEIEKWEEIEPRDWWTRPDNIPKSILKDRMKLLRQEMIKLDKML